MDVTAFRFFVFLAACLVLYALVPGRFRGYVLLAASLVFCLFAGAACLIFVLITWITVYFAARYLSVLSRPRRRKAVLVICLVLNLGILAVLKYTGFVLQTAALLSGSEESRSLALPAVLGISFYTFRAAGYLVDVYRGDAGAEKDPARLLLFICFFPQMTQGPVSRYGDLSRTLFCPEPLSLGRLGTGIRRMLWGFLKKLVIADRLAVAVAVLKTSSAELDGLFGLLGAMLFTVQLYFDFSGGIDIALGTAALFGVRLPENFDRPFLSRSVGEFWRKWHITLSSWLRDYLYFPLGGSRKGKWRAALNVLIVFAVSGLWHGAGWGYVLWGVCNGVFVALESLLGIKKRKTDGLRAVLSVCLTFILVSVAFLFMMHPTAKAAFRVLASVFTRPLAAFTAGNVKTLGLTGADWLAAGAGIAVTTAVSLLGRKASVKEWYSGSRFRVCASLVLLAAAVLIFGAYGLGYNAAGFVYGQF